MRRIIFAGVFFAGAAIGIGLTLAAFYWRSEAESRVFIPFEPSRPIPEAYPRQAALWDGSCPIEVDASGAAQFEGAEHVSFEPRNARGDLIGFYNVLRSAADMGDRKAIKCVLVYDWFNRPFGTPEVFYEYLWIAHYYGLTAPFEWWADTHYHLTSSQTTASRVRARRKFEEASAYFARSGSKRGLGPDPGRDTTTIDVKQADGTAFFDDIAAEISRLEALQSARPN